MTQPAMTLRVAAVDLGATSGRVMAARIGAGTSRLTEAHRFANRRSRSAAPSTGTCWACTGRCWTGSPRWRGRGAPHGIGIDSWAVDYGLLDQAGALIGNPDCHRDPRTR